MPTESCGERVQRDVRGQDALRTAYESREVQHSRRLIHLQEISLYLVPRARRRGDRSAADARGPFSIYSVFALRRTDARRRLCETRRGAVFLQHFKRVCTRAGRRARPDTDRRGVGGLGSPVSRGRVAGRVRGEHPVVTPACGRDRGLRRCPAHCSSKSSPAASGSRCAAPFCPYPCVDGERSVHEDCPSKHHSFASAC